MLFYGHSLQFFVFLTKMKVIQEGADWGQKVALDFLAQSGPPNPIHNTPHHK